MAPRRIFAAAGCLALLVLAGCTAKLDTDKIEVEVKRDLADRTGARIASVTCPDQVDAKKGDTFRCTARTVSGERVPIEVVQRDNKGGVTWRIARR